ncbi:RIB43A-like with coiled-coils protein 2 [Xiphophorus maculatus]|uniref:RIB43A domain with coiled-coils 2 n=1 Tax=Xiphophorus maculatus TaxID=8083 RepID=A0A3B5QM10_XIPMA|nr:RIB43A-like with coiled-coils protein 2 [Xiphophorus maculatus]XP_027881813.1 RIB43A-like with coiled-coils protein 2 [Xiphophorus couchianus]
MFQVELPRERKARESVERRRNYEADRRERIFNDKFRTIGVDKEALDLQVIEKLRRKAELKNQEDAHDADVQQYNRAACLLQRRQEKADRSAHQARAAFWHQNQNLQSRRDFDLNDPDALKKTESQMVLPGLLGEDPEAGSRQQRQQEQLRDWLLQQKNELQQKRLQMKIDALLDDQNREEMGRRAMELQNLEMAKRKADLINDANYNVAKLEEKMNREREQREDVALSALSIPALYPGANRKDPAETQQQVTQFQLRQVLEKKRLEMERKQREENQNRLLLDSARSALLLERLQEKQNKQLRKHLDSVNAQLAQIRLQETPDLKRGRIDDVFFTQFNTCSR